MFKKLLSCVDRCSRYFFINIIIKVLIVFIIGFLSRIFINLYVGLDVFVDFSNMITISYYSCLTFISTFIYDIKNNINLFNIKYLIKVIFNLI